MSLFTEFNILFPYLQSVRKIETYLSFDVQFPDTWKLPKKYVNEKSLEFSVSIILIVLPQPKKLLAGIGFRKSGISGKSGSENDEE